MSAEPIDPKILAQVKKLEQKYDAMGQDLSSYLDGLLHADYLTYWDYIHLDTLLSLQNPKTHFPDEKIFIIYHQITELYFQLILNEIEQIAELDTPDEKWFAMRLKRINRYLLHLVDSFDVMIDGMDQQQFLQFRMSLLPASGFQSGQLRLIELSCTSMIHLVEQTQRATLDPNNIEAMYPHLYWKKGATELATGKKTLTLRQFEEKYAEQFVKHASNYQFKNIWSKYKSDYEGCTTSEEIKGLLKQLDLLANVNWRLAHYKSAVRYLQRDPDIIAATGGTNWQQYLPPRFQKVIFYPELWSEDEIEDWGKSWVEETVFKSK
ncbi:MULTISPECIES: tryptophan 2,3-dioxygenase family protein [Reichenbachiella]|uniref:tryptophan 2,3-dioxygenase family protein n=1 Tax=Reichenbachiella TaxID=156993 RepID=UPI000E6C755C|nr:MULTISPECIES: tryptophan 2,3-dioxygenase family protein [Reichenbachiella]MBU2915269.1 tryptophan 2,3-dioxygenase [Reichenbachiella agariperforans]RJE70930.1 tryptophan 2,3-dioxygenase [Reichenbachiella sp. MSK19-1]